MKTEDEIEDFIKLIGLNSDVFSISKYNSKYYISTTECFQLSQLLKICEFLNIQDLIIESGCCVWRTTIKEI